MIKSCTNRLSGFILFLVLAGCNSKSDRQVIEFKPLEDLNYTMDSIPAGTPLKLIAYSGGVPNTEDEVYYFQFIGVDERNSDTMRILSTLISFTDAASVSGKTYTPTSQYNPDKRISDAVFYPQDSIKNLLINLSVPGIPESVVQELKKIDETGSKNLSKKQYVAINKSIDIFEKNYKTVIGVLHFTETPW